MYTAHPVPRLRHVPIGGKAMLHADGTQKIYTVKAIRDDGLISLWINGKEEILAMPYHKIVRLHSDYKRES